jgi:hypothetical protein
LSLSLVLSRLSTKGTTAKTQGLLKQKWMDDELGECTVTRRASYQGQRALWCTHHEGHELEKERSSTEVEEVREWTQQFGG